MSAVVVMPAYNAGRHLRGVLARLASLSDREIARVIVVDDGSSDDTREVLAQLGPLPWPLQIVERARNGGYGAAMKDGLAAALEHEATLVACVHADGQYSPEALPALVQRLRERRLDLLQGSRIASGTAKSGGMPLYKRVGNAVLNVLENRTLGLGLSDYHSGYLVYGARALSLPFGHFSNSFDFDLEVLACARARGLAVDEAPIPTHYGDEVSHLDPLSYGLRVLRVLWNFKRGHYAA
ncbi:MAG TPA: glycosyltransferase family 2 protein [Polyangiaceae bacterium]|nr:glycosyltransferase family 2 protein [Polyangiaceae bacterium]